MRAGCPRYREQLRRKTSVLSASITKEHNQGGRREKKRGMSSFLWLSSIVCGMKKKMRLPHVQAAAKAMKEMRWGCIERERKKGT